MTAVLIVDDSPFLRKEVREMVKRMDIDRVFEAADGEEALAVCEEERPDLILLDIVMEETNGIEFLEEIREKEGGEDYRVIVITALAEDAVKEKADELGVARFIEKPFEMEDIRDAIDHVLEA